MIILENLTQMQAAIERAKKKKPQIFLLVYGTYEVTGSKNDIYQVNCRINDAGQKLCYCTCEDRFPRQPNTACYHIAAVVGLHIYLSNCRIGYFGADDPDHKEAIAWCYLNY